MPNDTEIDNFIQRAEAGQNRIRSFAFIISVCICVLFSLVFISGFGNVEQPCKIELESRINPNDGPAASLIRLPGIGIVRAKAIVAYREEFRKKDSNNPAFRNCDDLCKVRGIGPQTAKNISEWLKFE
jgi:competence ComEA-like helix-hairpin-helix protein